MLTRFITSTENRVKMLKAMDFLTSCFNDEEDEVPWLYGGVPDGATEDDYESIANDFESMQHCCKLFAAIIRNSETETDEMFYF